MWRREPSVALITLVAIYRRSASALLVLGFLAGVIQLVDAAVGVFQCDLGKSIGPTIIAVASCLRRRLVPTGFDDLVKPINCQRNDNHLKLGNDGNLMKLRLRLTT
jgi:hypothetical protein